MPRHISHTPAPVTQPRNGSPAIRNTGRARASSARSKTRMTLSGSEVTEAAYDQDAAERDAREEAGGAQRGSRPGERAGREPDSRAQDHRRYDRAAGGDRGAHLGNRNRAWRLGPSGSGTLSTR